ncbi:MAG: hypothetical protein VW547_04660 [Alphaproteobacteria bacterium]
MSSFLEKITKALIASTSVAVMLLAGVTSANADHRWRNAGWHNGPEKKIVIVHKQRDVLPSSNYRMRLVKVLHVYHTPSVHRPRLVKVVQHYETHRLDPRLVFSRENGGAILGSVIGAVAGTQIGKGSGRIAAVIGGTVLGAVMGGHIGR